MSSTSSAPAFWQKLTGLFNDSVSHAFVLAGNVHDYVPASNDQYFRLTTFLVGNMLRTFNLIVVVDPARGLSFPIAGHRDVFVKLCGLDEEEDAGAGAGSPMLALLRGTQQQQQQGQAQAPKPPVKLPTSMRDITALLTPLLVDPQTLVNREGQEVTDDKGEPVPLRVAVILDYADLSMPDAPMPQTDTVVLTRLLQWARSPQVAQAMHLLLMIAESRLGLHGELRRASSRWEHIDIPLPSPEQRESFVEQRLIENPDLNLRDLSARTIANMTGALNLIQLEDILFRGLGAPDQTLTRDLTIQRKREIIKQEYDDVLDIQEPRFGLDRVGGYDYVKSFITRYVVDRWQANKLTVKGILLTGPAGTGKTQLAEAIAGACGVSFNVFKLSKILSKWQGESDQRLERVLRAVMSQAPVVLFLDEIDQLLGRGEDGSGGTNNRMFAAFLSFMEDPARFGKVLIVASTNRPELLDAAMLSRFDRVVPILAPTDDDRALVLKTLALTMDVALTVAPAHVTATRGWVGRDLRNLVAVAKELVETDGLDTHEALSEALKVFRPNLRDIGSMTASALRMVTDLRLLPPEWRERALEVQDAIEQEAQQADQTPDAEPVFTAEQRKRRRGDLG